MNVGQRFLIYGGLGYLAGSWLPTGYLVAVVILVLIVTALAMFIDRKK